MRTRTFIGLVFLIIALLVVSTPQLLDPAAQGIEDVSIKAGLMTDPVAAEKAAREADAKQSGGETAENRLDLKGFTLEEDGDLRDTTSPGDRDYNQRGRLEEGNLRQLMPGQKRGGDAYAPPYTAEDGVLLDVDGCPVFRAETNVTEILNDEDLRSLYADKADQADDPQGCRALLDARIQDATKVKESKISNPARQVDAIDRRSVESALISLNEIALVNDIMDLDELDARLADLTADDSSSSSGDTTTSSTGGAAATGSTGQ